MDASGSALLDALVAFCMEPDSFSRCLHFAHLIRRRLGLAGSASHG